MNDIQAVFVGPIYFRDFMEKDARYQRNVDRSEIRVYREDESIGKFEGQYVFVDPKMKTFGRRIIDGKELTTR